MASLCWSVLLVLILALVPEEALGRSAAGARRSLRSNVVKSDEDAVDQQDADEEEEDSSDDDAVVQSDDDGEQRAEEEDDDSSEDDAAGPAPAAAPAAVTLAAGPAPAAAPAAAIAVVMPQAPVGLGPADGDAAAPAAIEAPAAPAAIEAAPAAPAAQVMEAKMQEMVDAEKAVMNPQDPLSQLRQQLAAYAWFEDKLFAELAGMSEDVYRGKIAKAEALVAKDTTPGVAKMLGDMRREMHALAAPMYTKVLEEQITEVQAKQKVILAQIAALEAGPTPAPLAVEEPVKQGFPLLYVVLGCVLVLAAVIMIVMLCSRPSRDTDRNY